MNRSEFEEQVSEDPHLLADKIREGKIPFSDLTPLMDDREIFKPEVIKVAYLLHPDCTVDKFKENFHKTRMRYRNGFATIKPVLIATPLVKDIEIIAYILNSDKPDLDSIKKSFQQSPSSFVQLAKNPHANAEFKVMAYKMTNDESILPQTATDIFIF